VHIDKIDHDDTLKESPRQPSVNKFSLHDLPWRATALQAAQAAYRCNLSGEIAECHACSFYGAGFSMLWCEWKERREAMNRRCSNGHTVP